MKASQINVISLLTEDTKPNSPVKLVNKLYIVDTCPVYMYVVSIHTYIHTYPLLKCLVILMPIGTNWGHLLQVNNFFCALNVLYEVLLLHA